MMFLLELGVILGLGAIAVYLINASTFFKFWNFGRAQANKVGNKLDNVDPLAGLELAVADGIKQITEAKAGLKDAGAMVRRIQRELAGLDIDKGRLEYRIKKALAANDPNGTARTNALALADVKKKMIDKRQSLERAETLYKNFASRIKVGQERILEARDRAGHLKVQLIQSQQERELNEFANTMRFDPSGLLDGLSAAESIILQQIDENLAAGDVMEEFTPEDAGDAADAQMERDAEADEILKQFTRPEHANCRCEAEVPAAAFVAPVAEPESVFSMQSVKIDDDCAGGAGGSADDSCCGGSSGASDYSNSDDSGSSDSGDSGDCGGGSDD